MNKTISTQALSVLDQYLHIRIGSADCPVPYFNNKTVRARGALSVHVGKGSPAEIFDEVKSILFKNKISTDTLDTDSLKKILIEYKIGIDCSGFAYHLLDADNRAIGKGPLGKQLVFTQARGILGKIISSFSPAKNANVATFADDANSHTVTLHEIMPGDMITMLSNHGEGERDHILIVHSVDYVGSIPKIIHYSHSVAYPEDGLYNTGVRQGTIEFADPQQTLLEARWIEGGKEGEQNRAFTRAHRSWTELRRLI